MPQPDTESLLRSLLGSSLNGIIAMRAIRDDDKQRIVDFEIAVVNARACEMIGRSQDALIGHRLLDAGRGYATDGMFERYVTVVESGEPLDVEHYAAQLPSRPWLHTVAVKFGDGVAITVADVTERKRLEEQLLQSQKMEVIGRLAGGVAHDFKNLLTAISMNAELALEELEHSATGRPEVEGVLDGVRRAGALTQQLLAFARQQTMEPRVVRLDEVVRHSLPLLRRLLGGGSELVLTVADEPWSVSIDPVKFEQVLTNLTVNAHDAMPGGGHLSLEVSNFTVKPGDAAAIRRVAPGDYARLDVADTGTGMPPEVLQHIFEPFFTTKEATSGTGLGLATSFAIVQQAGGMIWATSTVGRGSTFTTLLPRVHAPADAWPAAPTAERPSPGTERVLVVDDEASVRAVVARTLARLGYSVTAAGHGEEAMRALDEYDAFDLILTDVVMPRMGGRELQRLVRKRFPAMPVLLMSGYEAESSASDTPVLKKPFSAVELGRAVREALDTR